MAFFSSFKIFKELSKVLTFFSQISVLFSNLIIFNFFKLTRGKTWIWHCTIWSIIIITQVFINKAVLIFLWHLGHLLNIWLKMSSKCDALVCNKELWQIMKAEVKVTLQNSQVSQESPLLQNTIINSVNFLLLISELQQKNFVPRDLIISNLLLRSHPFNGNFMVTHCSTQDVWNETGTYIINKIHKFYLQWNATFTTMIRIFHFILPFTKGIHFQT